MQVSLKQKKKDGLPQSSLKNAEINNRSSTPTERGWCRGRGRGTSRPQTTPPAHCTVRTAVLPGLGPGAAQGRGGRARLGREPRGDGGAARSPCEGPAAAPGSARGAGGAAPLVRRSPRPRRGRGGQRRAAREARGRPLPVRRPPRRRGGQACNRPRGGGERPPTRRAKGRCRRFDYVAATLGPLGWWARRPGSPGSR